MNDPEPDMIDMMSETELRTELRKLVKQAAAASTQTDMPPEICANDVIAELETALAIGRKIFAALDWKKDKELKNELQIGMHSLRLALSEERRRRSVTL